MQTFKLTISYDGTAYCGWQVQPNGPTIQEMLEQAIERITQQQVRVTASGRTDAGVHALGQVASCEIDTQLTTATLKRALNGNLPDDIRVVNVESAARGFHAIRDARRKCYRYDLCDGELHNVFLRKYAWHVPQPLDVEAMRKAAQPLTGTHDFASFQAAGSDRNSTTRTIFNLLVQRDETNAELIRIEITANGFLYNMARNIVGTLVEVGRGSQSVNWPQAVLSAADRRLAGPTAPACGLFLVNVSYYE